MDLIINHLQNIGIGIGIMLGFVFLSRLKKKSTWQELATNPNKRALWYSLCCFVYFVSIISMMFVAGIARSHLELQQEVKSGNFYWGGKRVESTSEIYEYAWSSLFMSQEERKIRDYETEIADIKHQSKLSGLTKDQKSRIQFMEEEIKRYKEKLGNKTK